MCVSQFSRVDDLGYVFRARRGIDTNGALPSLMARTVVQYGIGPTILSAETFMEQSRPQARLY